MSTHDPHDQLPEGQPGQEINRQILSPAYGLYTDRNHPLPEKIISENNTPATPTTLTTPATLNHEE